MSKAQVVSADPDGLTSDNEGIFFFYGTLLVPAILTRVLGHSGADFTFQSAVLSNYSRHCVKGEDYPAIINRDHTKKLVDSGIASSDEIFVRGTIVSGLDERDIELLDAFEGHIQSYTRVRLPVNTHGPAKSFAKYELPDVVDLAAYDGRVKAWTYVWTDLLSALEPEVWSYKTFMAEKVHNWTEGSKEYDDVDKIRAVAEVTGAPLAASPEEEKTATMVEDGDENRLQGRQKGGYEDFGHGMLKHWKFRDGHINLNHGSYGSPPRAVLDAMRKISDEVESDPNLYMKRKYFEPLNNVRTHLAGLMGAREDEVVLVPNTTHGINNIVNQIDWKDGDGIVIFNSTYNAVAQTMKYLCDRNPQMFLETIDITFPQKHAEVLQTTEALLQKYNNLAVPAYTGESAASGLQPDSRIRLLVVDAISSNPGVIFPWQEIAALCKRYGVLSLVDGAHAIGQIPLDLKSSDCDFFVSNCHKWLMSHRGNAVLYVPQRNQRLIRSSFPTGASYESARYPMAQSRNPSFTAKYEWTGTQDWTPILTISDAIRFRESIGGEYRIMDYCHSLAVEGGKHARTVLGTSIMDNSEGELTAAMTNVELPLEAPANYAEWAQQLKFFEDEMFQHDCFVAVFPHGKVWWARFSAQVWNELSDFEAVAKILKGICKRIQQGEHQQSTERLEDQPGPDPQNVAAIDE